MTILNAGISKVVTIVPLFIMAVTMGACTREVQLPVLYQAPDFTLTNQDGREVRLSDFQGKVVVLNFIYSRCPNICGEENYRLQCVWEQLEKGLRQDVVLVSVSFDTFDTPEIMKQYENFFDVP